jgi:hypothetical protein
MSNQYAQGGNAGGDLQHTLADSNNNRNQQGISGQQNLGAMAGSQRRSSSLATPQTATTSSAAAQPSMAHFQGFGDHNYMDVDYGLAGRADVNDQAEAFESQSQLEAALAESEMREQLYQAIGRR